MAMKSLQDRVAEYVKEDIKALKRLKIQKTLLINFPGRQRIPFWSRIALKIVLRQGGVIDTRVTDAQK